MVWWESIIVVIQLAVVVSVLIFMMQKNKYILPLKEVIFFGLLLVVVMGVLYIGLPQDINPIFRMIGFIVVVMLSMKFIYHYSVKRSIVETLIFFFCYALLEALSSTLMMRIFSVSLFQMQSSLFYNLVMNTVILFFGLLMIYPYNKYVLKKREHQLGFKLLIINTSVLLISVLALSRMYLLFKVADDGQNLFLYLGVIMFIAVIGVLTIMFSAMYTKNQYIKTKLLETEEKYRFDPLTNTFSREFGLGLLGDRRKICRRIKDSFVIAYIDIDNFKYINDNYGHKKGDEVLKGVSELLMNLLREDDIIIRLGGDEFLVGFMNTTKDEAEKVLKRVNRELRADQMYDKISISYGLKSICHQNKETLDTLIASADLAMYTMKTSYRNHRTTR